MAHPSWNPGEFLNRHRLPDSFAEVAGEYYVPLATWLYEQIKQGGPDTFFLGINGAQGTGKTTLSNFLAEYLRTTRDVSVAELSIDDLYLTRAERADLAEQVHPMLATRGVPGTHDVELGKALIDELCSVRAGETMAVPRFDKAIDDRRPESEWREVTGPIDLIILEGWCVGSTAQPAEELEKPVNRLEAEEDADCAWRNFVNEQLATTYRNLFSVLDAIVFLQAPGFDAIYRWRLEQERKLADSVGTGATHVMDGAALTRFLEYYERITRHNLVSMPARADVVLQLDEDHAITRASYAN